MKKFDKLTTKWFANHPAEAMYGTTVCQCNLCGLYYKPSLGHECMEKEGDVK